MQERSAGAVIFRVENDQKLFLLLQYQKGHWDFVKGNIEQGEAPKETMVRETKEETGITDIQLMDGFQEKISWFYRDKNGNTIFKEVIFFLAETHQKEVKLSFEHVGFDWLGFEEAFHKLTYSNAKNLLKKANNFLMKGGEGTLRKFLK